MTVNRSESDPSQASFRVSVSDVAGDFSDNAVAGRDLYFSRDTHLHLGASASKAARPRLELIRAVRESWISGYLDQQVFRRVFMDIGMKLRDDLVLSRRIYTAQRAAADELRELPLLANEHLFDLFSRSGRTNGTVCAWSSLP